MKMRLNLPVVVVFGLAVVFGVALLHTSQRVQEAEERLVSLRADIAREEEMVHVLEVEWTYLTRPERLERLAQEHLNLEPFVPKEMPEAVMGKASSLPQDAAGAESDKKYVAQPASHVQGGR